LGICDEVEEKELEVFRPQIELDLGEGSSIFECGEPPVEAAGEAPIMVEIIDESSEEGMDVEERTGAEPVQSGGIPVHEAEAGDLCFEDYPRDDFEKVGEITPKEIS